MHTYIHKTQESKKLSPVNVLAQNQNRRNPVFQFLDNRPETIIQRRQQEMVDRYAAKQPSIQRKATSEFNQKTNNTGLPEHLKTGIEVLSGYSMDDVSVHYNSAEPAQLNAHAYAQGTDIHLGVGQEKHLAHEAWHVVQQKQGRVKPTKQMKGKMNINDDVHLEKEADIMGAKALQVKSKNDFTESFLLLGSEGIARETTQLIKKEELTKGEIYQCDGTSYKYEGIYNGKPDRFKGRYHFIGVGGDSVGPMYLTEDKLENVTLQLGAIDTSKDDKPSIDIAERPETIPSDLSDAECQQLGDEAITYARGIIPLAGNQKEDVAKDEEAYWKSQLTKNIQKGFTTYVKKNSAEGGELKASFVGVPPYIRKEIIEHTGGGTCGDYAVLISEYIRKKGKPVKVFKSDSHAEHAWVVLKSKTGTEWYIDAWPTEVRDVVKAEEFFTAVHNQKTREFIDHEVYGGTAKDELDGLWKAYWSEKKATLEADLKELTRQGVKFEITDTVKSTRK